MDQTYMPNAGIQAGLNFHQYNVGLENDNLLHLDHPVQVVVSVWGLCSQW
jgi:hypothetical protein